MCCLEDDYGCCHLIWTFDSILHRSNQNLSRRNSSLTWLVWFLITFGVKSILSVFGILFLFFISFFHIWCQVDLVSFLAFFSCLLFNFYGPEWVMPMGWLKSVFFIFYFYQFNDCHLMVGLTGRFKACWS